MFAPATPPSQPSPLSLAREELARQEDQVHAWVDRHGEALMDRPPTGKWCVAEHLTHLAMLNGPYLRTMKAAARRGREEGITGSGPYRNQWMGRLMIRFMEPPPRPRMPTMKSTVPRSEGLTLADALRDYERSQDAFRALLDDAEGLDLGRLTVTSPFAGWMSFTLDQAIRLLLAHNRRHLWLADEALEQLGLKETGAPGTM